MNRLVKHCERNFPNCLNADGKLMWDRNHLKPSPDEVIIGFLGSKTFQIMDSTKWRSPMDKQCFKSALKDLYLVLHFPEMILREN